MRKKCINTLIELAKDDERIFLITGDLGYSVLEGFQAAYPDRFLNAGVAEQNMIGVAAGLALSGKIVYVYSIVPFLVMRCFEQIRNDVCFQNLNVRLIGVGGGVAYGSAGATHHSREDIGILRTLSNMTIVSPGDPLEAEEVVKRSVRHKGPMYIRLGKGNEQNVHKSLQYEIGESIVLEEGRDMAIIASGSMLRIAKQLTEELEKEKLSVMLLSMPTIKPVDRTSILKACSKTKVIFTLEEHGIIGGLGSAVAEVIAEGCDKRIGFKRFGIEDTYRNYIGSQEFLLKENGLSIEKIKKSVLEEWGKMDCKMEKR